MRNAQNANLSTINGVKKTEGMITKNKNIQHRKSYERFGDR